MSTNNYERELCTADCELTIKRTRGEGIGLPCLLCKTSFQNLKLLKCLHYFCNLCLRKNLQSQLLVEDGQQNDMISFYCPLCDFQHDWKEGENVDDILKGIFESQILATINDQESVLMGISFCVPCKNRNKDTVSVNWCYDCRSHLCEKCLDFHNSMPTLTCHKTFTDDELLSQIDLLSSARDVCEVHLITLRMFCITHKTACCNTCIVDAHLSCQLVDLKTHAALAEETIDELRMSLSKISCDLEDTLDKTLIEEELTEGFFHDNAQILNESFRKLKTNVLSKEDDLIAKTHKLFCHEMEINETKTTAFKGKSSVLENCKDILKVSLSGSDVRFFLEKAKVQKIFGEVQDFFENDRSNTNTFSINLSFDISFMMLTNLESFGEIKSEESPCHLQSEEVCLESSYDHMYFDTSQSSVVLRNLCPPLSPLSPNLSPPLSPLSPCIVFNGRQFSRAASFDVEDGDSHITGCDWISKDEIIVVDMKTQGDSEVRVYNLQGKKLKTIVCLGGKPYDVAVLKSGNAAITVPKQREIWILDLRTGHMLDSHDTEMDCYGVSATPNDILVVAGEKKILLMDSNGAVRKSISVDGDDIRYVYAVSNNLIFYSSLRDCSVYSIIGNGDKRYHFQSHSLKGAAGLIVDSDKNAVVCEKGSNSVFVLDRSGDFEEYIEVGSLPTAIAYSKICDKICIVRGGRREHNITNIYS